MSKAMQTPNKYENVIFKSIKFSISGIVKDVIDVEIFPQKIKHFLSLKKELGDDNYVFTSDTYKIDICSSAISVDLGKHVYGLRVDTFRTKVMNLLLNTLPIANFSIESSYWLTISESSVDFKIPTVMKLLELTREFGSSFNRASKMASEI